MNERYQNDGMVFEDDILGGNNDHEACKGKGERKVKVGWETWKKENTWMERGSKSQSLDSHDLTEHFLPWIHERYLSLYIISLMSYSMKGQASQESDPYLFNHDPWPKSSWLVK